jgi:hypothetical protein
VQVVDPSLIHRETDNRLPNIPTDLLQGDMSSSSKRARSEFEDQGEALGEPASLARTISPPRKKKLLQNTSPKVIPSPWKLTWIRDLPEEMNRDALTLKDILGDPLISECWEFNYLHDVHFLMAAFDPDVRHLVRVHIVHGFWKREDANRLQLVVSTSSLRTARLLSIHIQPLGLSC